MLKSVEADYFKTKIFCKYLAERRLFTKYFHLTHFNVEANAYSFRLKYLVLLG